MDREDIYLAALLHDIGKFTERTKREELSEKFKNKTQYGHPKYSAQLLEALQQGDFFSQFSEETVEAVLYHHQPSSMAQKIIQAADRLSAKERLTDEESTGMYYQTPLESIFQNIFAPEQDSDYAYKLGKLDLANILPHKDITINEHNYRRLVKDFKENELRHVQSLNQLYYLLEKYLWCVPAQTYKMRADVSLFDHIKTTAAIAICLYDQYENGHITESDLNNFKKSQFILIGGDISGIQNFIMDITSGEAAKGVAKGLKGRSVYLDLLSKVVTRYILKKLNLKRANLLYNGGGNFYILAPKGREDEFLAIKDKISQKMLTAHKGQLYLALVGQDIQAQDFQEFNKVWDNTNKKLKEDKLAKWHSLLDKKKKKDIFGPKKEGIAQKKECPVCGHSIKAAADDKCSLCYSYELLADDIKDARYLNIETVKQNKRPTSSLNTYNDILAQFGYQMNFSYERKKQQASYLLNDTHFLQKGCTGFIFGAYQLPMQDNKQITFAQLSYPALLDETGNKVSAKKEEGDRKLGILKMDVDNLGRIFSEGLGKNRTISRVSTLSRMFGQFFKGYINQLIAEKNWQDNVYVTYSGGDDSFIIGTWNVLFEFAQSFYNKFREFTCHNPKITLSAGLDVFRYNFPVVKSAKITEKELQQAKKTDEYDPEDNLPLKDNITFFGEKFSWLEFMRIKNIRDILLEIVQKTQNRALLYKVERSTLGFKNLLKDSTAGLYNNVKFWRLAYYLREIKQKDEQTVEKLIKEYEDIIVNNVVAVSDKKKIKSIMIIPAAVRWAEMETRK